MRFTLAFVLLVCLLSAPARAEMIEYEMTGTITSTSSIAPPNWGPSLSPFANGDRITWALQYDRSTPPSGPGTSSYAPTDAVIANVADQTKGYSNLTSSYNPWSQSSLELSGSASGSSLQAQFSSHGVDTGLSAELKLGFKSPLGSQLNQVQLSSVPLDGPNSSFKFTDFVNVAGFSFTASVDSISDAPEPGSLTLLGLGASCLAGYGWRRKLAGSCLIESL